MIALSWTLSMMPTEPNGKWGWEIVINMRNAREDWFYREKR